MRDSRETDEVLVCMAQRLQGQVERQLTLVERLHDAGPDDSLADLAELRTTLQLSLRGIENLLVMGGAQQGPRSRGPRPLADVLADARAGVDDAARVDLGPAPDARVAPRAVGGLLALFTELLNHALGVSPERTTVEVASMRAEDGGVTVEVAADSAGPTPGELDELNRRLADRPIIDDIVSNRVGLFVAARIAARCGVTLRVHQRRVGGHVTVVHCPPDLLDAVGVDTPRPWQRAPYTGYDTPANGNGANGYAANGYGSTGYAPNGYGSSGHGSNGYDSNGYSANGYDPKGSGSTGYGSTGYGSTGYGSTGYGSTGYGSTGYGSTAYGGDGSGSTGNGANGYGPNGNGSNGYGARPRPYPTRDPDPYRGDDGYDPLSDPLPERPRTAATGSFDEPATRSGGYEPRGGTGGYPAGGADTESDTGPYEARPGSFDAPPSRSGAFDAPSRSGAFDSRSGTGSFDASPPSRSGAFDAPPSRSGSFDAPSRSGAFDAPSSRSGAFDAPSRSGAFDAPPSRSGAFDAPSSTGGFPPRRPAGGDTGGLPVRRRTEAFAPSPAPQEPVQHRPAPWDAPAGPDHGRADELFGPLTSSQREHMRQSGPSPIYEAIASAWFIESDEDGGGAPADWSTPSDAEWREASERASRPDPDDLPPTAAGLPRRRPGTQMVAPPLRRGAPTVAPIRDREPERVRERLAVYQQGLERGRHRSPDHE